MAVGDVDEYVQQIHRETGLPIEELMLLHEQELSKQIPRDEDGVLTSIGSVNHNDDEKPKCSPCLFWFRESCVKGIKCAFCHFPHKGQKNKRIRPSKTTRQR